VSTIFFYDGSVHDESDYPKTPKGVAPGTPTITHKHLCCSCGLLYEEADFIEGDEICKLCWEEAMSDYQSDLVH
jgi:hypothetical protein